jgi:hypothetical protein
MCIIPCNGETIQRISSQKIISDSLAVPVSSVEFELFSVSVSSEFIDVHPSLHVEYFLFYPFTHWKAKYPYTPQQEQPLAFFFSPLPLRDLLNVVLSFLGIKKTIKKIGKNILNDFLPQ